LIVIKEEITLTVDTASEKKYDITDAESEQMLQSMRDDWLSLQQEAACVMTG